MELILNRPTSKSTLQKLRQKARLLEQQGHRCCYCGCPLELADTTIDHVIARANGGANSLDNKVASCSRCNEGFADVHPKEKLLAIFRRFSAFLSTSGPQAGMA